MTRHNDGPMGDHREVLHGNHLIPREPNAYLDRIAIGSQLRPWAVRHLKKSAFFLITFFLVFD